MITYWTLVDWNNNIWKKLTNISSNLLNPFPNDQILDSFKLKEFVDNFKLDENGKKFSKRGENTVDFSFSYSVFKRLLLQTRKNQGLFGKGFILCLNNL